MANCGDFCTIIHQEKVSECRAIRDVILKTVPLRFLVTENKTGNKYSCTEILILTTMCVWVRRGGVYRVLLGKPEGRRPLGRPRRKWVDNIRTDLQEVGSAYMVWIGLAQFRDRWRTLVSAVKILRVPCYARNFLTICKPDSFSRRTLHHGVSKQVSTCTWHLGSS
jgi:hypothetical protein